MLAPLKFAFPIHQVVVVKQYAHRLSKDTEYEPKNHISNLTCRQ